MSDEPRAAASFLGFALQAVSLSAGIVALGLILLRDPAPGTVPAMIVGTATALIGSLVGGLAARRLVRSGPGTMMFGAMGTRLTVVVVLGLVAAISGRWPIVPLLISLAITHLALLIVDSRDAMSLTRYTS
jgi:hypothetical protein